MSVLDDELVKCGYCGNIWDGCAQCDCYNIFPEIYNRVEESNQVC